MKDLKSKYKGMTFANAAKKIDSKYKFRKFDSLQDKAYQEEMKILMGMQEDVMAKRSANEFVIGQATNPEQIMEQQSQMEVPAMKEGGSFPDKYKKMGFSGVNKPKRTPGASKSHAVVVKDGDSYKLIRFGQQGVSGAGKNPTTDKEKARRKSFKARHAKNIAKGKTSAAYWANKVKWAEGGWIQQAADKMKEKGTEGAFTRSAKQASMGVQAYATKVLNDPDASTTQKRRANFAKNMAKINKKKMAVGGPMTNISDYIVDTALEQEVNKQTTNYLPMVSPFIGGNIRNMKTPSLLDSSKKSKTALERQLGITTQEEVERGKVSEVPTIQTLMDKRLLEDSSQDLENMYSMDSAAESQMQESTQYKNAKGQYENRKPSSAYDPAIAGSRLNKLINAGIILGGPERRSPVFNPYEADVMNKVNAMNVSLDPARQSMMSNANAAIGRISNMTRSASGLRANIANIYANMNTGLANIDMQQQQQLNTIRQSQASILNNLGVNRQQSISVAKEINDRNRAAWQSEVSRFGAAVMDDNKFQTRMQVQEGQNMLMAKILSDSFKDFGLSADLISKMSKGEFGALTNQELIELKNKLPDTEFENFGKVYKENTGKDVPDVKVDKKKSESVTQQTTTSNSQTIGAATTPAAPTPARTQTNRQQAIGTAMGAASKTQNQNTQSTSGNNTSTSNAIKGNGPEAAGFTSDNLYNKTIDMLNFEARQGGPGGTSLKDNFGNPDLPAGATIDDAAKYFNDNILSRVKNEISGSDEEVFSIADHWYNAGTDARIYAVRAWLEQKDPNNTTGWKESYVTSEIKKKTKGYDTDKGPVYDWTDDSEKQRVINMYNQIPPAQRRDFLKKGRDWYYQNLKTSPLNYKTTWSPRLGVTGP